VRGEARTGEELGRAFPGVTVRTSAADRVLDTVGEGASIVVATPGAEPVAAGGYACVVLLDTWLPLSRPDLRTEEESLRRWLNAAALARPGPAGGRVVAVGDSTHPALQALLRWDPAGFARREMAERMEAHLPPASRMAVLSGPEPAVAEAVQALELPAGAEVLGPAPVTDLPRRAADATAPDEPDVRMVIRVPRAAGLDLARTLTRMRGVRDAKKLAPVRVQLDPHGLG
jgi:primosomal protein N' (replication factor Y)